MTDRLTWLAERQQGIGGSDVAPILGIPSYAGASSLRVYRSKTEEVRDDKETEAMYWGNVMEPHLIAEYGRRTGMAVTPNDSVVHHPDFPQLRGTVDAYVNDPEYGEGILEVKNNSFGFKWGNPDDDASVSVPRHYYVQVVLDMVDIKLGAVLEDGNVSPGCPGHIHVVENLNVVVPRDRDGSVVVGVAPLESEGVVLYLQDSFAVLRIVDVSVRGSHEVREVRVVDD